jgi:3' terminal RNA ribose 2'-O-methyltransferase Hen1
MILTISTTHSPATDLGFLLHKHPDRVHTLAMGFGTALVIYPEATAERASASLIVDVDAVGLVRGHRGGGSDFSLEPYVNDRPYAVSSFLSVAMGKMFSTAMSGRSKERPELAHRPIALEVSLPVVPCRGGEAVIRRLFEPLGYAVEATPIAVDAVFPAWGDSRYLALRLAATLRLKDLLEHLFVLLPVLDDDKHYWVGADEVDKLLRRGGDWLASHPERNLIAGRYLRHDRALTHQAMARLSEDDPVDPDEASADNDAREEIVEATARPIPADLVASGRPEEPTLHRQRLAAVVEVVAASGARRVVDLGCGEGRLVQALLTTTHVHCVVGVDVSHRALELAARRLHLESMAPRQRQRVELLQGSLTYRDARLQGFDAATLIEVIEHVEPSRLTSVERVLFGHAHPRLVVVTTPNIEYNVRFAGLAPGALRHRDHRFEWTRGELAAWATGVADRHGYEVTISGVGPDDPEVGAPTQMAAFRARAAL